MIGFFCLRFRLMLTFASKNQSEDRLRLGIDKASFVSALGLHYHCFKESKRR